MKFEQHKLIINIIVVSRFSFFIICQKLKKNRLEKIATRKFGLPRVKIVNPCFKNSRRVQIKCYRKKRAKTSWCGWRSKSAKQVRTSSCSTPAVSLFRPTSFFTTELSSKSGAGSSFFCHERGL